MNTVEQELKTLQAERNKVAATIADADTRLAGAQKDIDDAKRRLTELTAAMAPVQQLVGQLNASLAAAEAERKAAASRLEDGKRFLSELQEELKKELPQVRRDAIDKAIDAVDSEITTLKASLATLEEQKVGVESRLAAAQRRAGDADAAFRAALAGLRQLPDEIRQARTGVDDLNKAATDARQAKRPAEAYFLLRELEWALAALESRMDHESEVAVTNRLFERRSDAQAAQREIAMATAELERVNRERQATETELQRKTKDRESSIKTRFPLPDSRPGAN